MTRIKLQIERVGCSRVVGVGMVVEMIVAIPDVEVIAAGREGGCSTGENWGMDAKL